MSDDPLESLARAAAQDNDDALQDRMAKERRTQTIARRTRKSLRWSIFGLAVLGFSLIYFGSGRLQLLGFLCFLLVVVLGAALFFMGGLAPARVRRRLSKRERSLLDN